MNVKQLLRKTAKEFSLVVLEKGNYKFIQLPRRAIIIRNYLSGWNNPDFVKYGNAKKIIGKELERFLASEEYKEYYKSPQGCVLTPYEVSRELEKAETIHDTTLREEVIATYKKIQQAMGNSKRLTLIWKPTKQEKDSGMYTGVLLHEFIHELFEHNHLHPRSWKWNEGLVTYAAHYTLGTHVRFIEKPLTGGRYMWNTYMLYAHKWAKLLKDKHTPEERLYTIIRKIKEVDRTFRKHDRLRRAKNKTI